MAQNYKISNSKIICELHNSSPAEIQYFRFNKGKYNKTVIWYDCHVAVYKGCTLQIEKVLSETVLDVHVKEDSLFVLVESGKFYQINMRHKKEMKNGKSKKVKKNTTKVSSQDLNQNIFSGLLAEHSKETKSNDDRTDDYVLIKAGIVNFTFTFNKVVTLSLKSDSCHISFFPSDILLNRELQRNENLNRAQEYDIDIQLKCAESSLCKIKAAALCEAQQNIVQSFKSKVFLCYKTSSDIDRNLIIHGKSCILQSNIFNCLFGTSVALSDSSVLLVAFPNGEVYYIPVLPLASSRGRSNFPLYDLEQPIANIHGLRIEKGDEYSTFSDDTTATYNPGDCNCVVIIGVHGKVVFIFLGTENNVCYCEDHLPGPVYASTVVNNVILHSDLLNTYSSHCWLEKDGHVKRLTPEPIGFRNAIHISLIQSKSGYVVPLSSVQLMAVTKFGRMYTMEVNLCDKTLNSLPSFSTVGQEIGDLLTSISNLSVQLDKLDHRLTKQDDNLQQLSLASVLASSYEGQHENSVLDFPLNVSAHINQRKSGTSITYHLVISLLSSKTLTISENWHAIVSISSQRPDHLGTTFKFSKTVQLKDLCKEKEQEIELALQSYNLLDVLPLYVDVTLVLTISVDPYNKICGNFGKSSSFQNIIVPCFQTNIDILHVLIPNTDSVSNGKETIGHVNSLIDGITKEMPCFDMYKKDCDGASKNEVKQLKANACKILLPELVMHHFVYNNTKKDTKPEVCLLEMLFSGNNFMKDAIRGQLHLKLVSPTNNQILISIVKEEKSGSQKWEIHIQAFCIHELCLIRTAVIQRIVEFSKLIEKLPGRDKETVSTHNLRKYMREIEAVKDEIQSVQSANHQISSGDRLKHTVQLYSLLRGTNV